MKIKLLQQFDLHNLQDITKGYHQSSLTQHTLKVKKMSGMKGYFLFSCSLEPCTLELRVHLEELKPCLKKVGDVTYTEDEVLQCAANGACLSIASLLVYMQVSAVKKTAKNAAPNVPPISSVAILLKGTHSEQENAVNGQYLHTQCPLMHACMYVLLLGAMLGSQSILPSCPCSRGGSAYASLLKP